MSDISELFSRDPLSLTRDDRSKIIAKYRDDRARYLLGAKSPKAAKPTKAKAPTGGGLSLDDLED